ILLTSAADTLGTAIKLSIEVKTFESAMRMVEVGLGIGIMPEGVLRRAVDDDRVRAVPLLDEWAKRPHVICVRGDHPLTTAALRMLDHLRGGRAQPAAIAPGGHAKR